MRKTIVKRQTMPSLFATKAIKRTKVNDVKVWLKAHQQKTLARVASQDGITFGYAEVADRKTLYYIVCASDGSSRKLYDEQQAMTAYEQLINFEKRQLQIK